MLSTDYLHCLPTPENKGIRAEYLQLSRVQWPFFSTFSDNLPIAKRFGFNQIDTTKYRMCTSAECKAIKSSLGSYMNDSKVCLKSYLFFFFFCFFKLTPLLSFLSTFCLPVFSRSSINFSTKWSSALSAQGRKRIHPPLWRVMVQLCLTGT